MMNSIENIKRKLTLLNDVQMSHEQDDIHIQKAQEYLDVKLPNSFKEYLKEFGNLSFTGYEFYGLTKLKIVVSLTSFGLQKNT